MRKGFTLIEMSVVLLIIGLLVGGILAGKALIRTSRLQTVIGDVGNYQGAVAQFKQKYNALPGDMNNATDYWGTNPNCSTSGAAGTGTQTCNGTGAGVVVLSAAAPYEQFLVWQHLANGGFIPGQYTGTSLPSATSPATFCQIGSNCPRGRLGQTYFLQYASGALGGAGFWAQNAGHYLVIGGVPPAGTSSGYAALPFLSGSEALSLDSKTDDGLPGTGLWKSFNANATPGYTPNCVIATDTGLPPPDGSQASAAKSVYQANATHLNTGAICSLEVNLSF